MTTAMPNTLASYTQWLMNSDDAMRLRIILHDFGLVWEEADQKAKPVLVADEPILFDPRWDAFVAAYVEHVCWHAQIEAPQWVFEPQRYLSYFWFPGADLPSLRVEAVVHSPAAFEAHGVLLAARELQVV